MRFVRIAGANHDVDDGRVEVESHHVRLKPGKRRTGQTRG
jgi:hypothetical protein